MMRFWGSENYKLKSNPYLHRNHKNGNFKQKCCNNAKAASTLDSLGQLKM